VSKPASDPKPIFSAKERQELRARIQNATAWSTQVALSNEDLMRLLDYLEAVVKATDALLERVGRKA